MASVKQYEQPLNNLMDELGNLEPDEIAQVVKNEVGEHTAVCKSAEECAIAVLILKRLNIPEKGIWVSVGAYSSEIGTQGDDGYVHAYHPESVENFIKKFDQHLYPELEKPFTDSDLLTA